MYFRKSHRNTDLTNYIMIQYIPCKVTSGHIRPEKATIGLRSIGIRAAFLQAKGLDREVYMEPPKDIRKQGKLWKLKKPLYGLNNASCKFWLKVREVFNKCKLRILDGDEVFISDIMRMVI